MTVEAIGSSCTVHAFGVLRERDVPVSVSMGATAARAWRAAPSDVPALLTGFVRHQTGDPITWVDS